MYAPKRKYIKPFCMYRICSIRCHGYYLFYRAILCSFYLRAAFIKLRVLGIIGRPLRKSSFIGFTKNCDAVTWFWSKPSSLISCHFDTKRYLPTQHLQYISFNGFTRWSPSVPEKMTNFSGQPAFLYLSTGYRVLAAASIRERRLFRSARPEVRRQFKSGD